MGVKLHNDEPDFRPYIISEVDQILAGMDDGDPDAYDRGRDWLADLVSAGDHDVITTLLRGFQHEMIPTTDNTDNADERGED